MVAHFRNLTYLYMNYFSRRGVKTLFLLYQFLFDLCLFHNNFICRCLQLQIGGQYFIFIIECSIDLNLLVWKLGNLSGKSRIRTML